MASHANKSSFSLPRLNYLRFPSSSYSIRINYALIQLDIIAKLLRMIDCIFKTNHGTFERSLMEL